jgi:hypothetical protein
MRGALPTFTHALMAWFLCIRTTTSFQNLFALLVNSDMKTGGYENRDTTTWGDNLKGIPGSDSFLTIFSRRWMVTSCPRVGTRDCVITYILELSISFKIYSTCPTEREKISTHTGSLYGVLYYSGVTFIPCGSGSRNWILNVCHPS